MALWPFSRASYESDLHVFLAVSRRYWLPEFWRYNLREVRRELLVLAPIAALVVSVSATWPFRAYRRLAASPRRP